MKVAQEKLYYTSICTLARTTSYKTEINLLAKAKHYKYRILPA